MAQVTNIPAQLDIVGYCGDDFSIQVQFWSDEAHTVPMPITGTMAAQVRREIQCTDKWDLVITPDELVTNKATVTCTHEVSSLLREYAVQTSFYNGNELVSGLMFNGYWDLQETNGGQIRTFLRGKFVAIAEVTR